MSNGFYHDEHDTRIEAEVEHNIKETRIRQLEALIKRQQFIEDRYEELMLSARRVLRYNGVDAEMHEASMKAMGFLIRRHATEIDEMEACDAD